MADWNATSALLRIASGAMGANHPIRLAIAVASGMAIKVAIHVAASMFPNDPALRALSEFNAAWYAIISAGLFFAPIVFGRKGTPETAVHQINTVQALIERAGLSAAQKRMIWFSLIEKYIKAAQPDLSKSPSLFDLFKEVESEKE